jgi:hypothetical protein
MFPFYSGINPGKVSRKETASGICNRRLNIMSTDGIPTLLLKQFYCVTQGDHFDCYDDYDDGCGGE